MKKNKIFAMILGTIVFVMVMFGCTTDQNTDQTSEPVTTNPSGNGGNNGSTKITSLQQVISSDEVQNGSKTVIDLSEYSDIENYDAIINKAVTIKNGDDLKDAVLNIVSDGVILDGIKQASVTTQSSMKISGSSLSSLSIASVSSSNASVITSRGGTSTMLSAGISASRSLSDVEMNGRGSAFPPIVEVYNTEVEEDVSVGIVNAYLMVKEFTAKKNVILNAVNAQLTITDKRTNIKEIKSDKSCLVILEEGTSATIATPTVTGSGVIKQIDMKASGEVKLLALAPVSELPTLIKQGEAIDFSTIAVLGSYQADDGVTAFKTGDLPSDITERFSKPEKDFTITIDGKTAYQAGQNVSTFQWADLSVGTHTATLNSNYQYKDNETYTLYTFEIVVIGANETQSNELPTFKLTAIEVKSDAAKTEYTVGEPLNLSGLLVLGTYKENGGEVTYQNVISDYTLDPPNGTPLTTENKSVKVTIGNVEKTVTINVNPIQEEPETNPVIYTFKVNGGKWNDDTTEDKTFSGKSGAALTAPTPIRIGYTFNNWNENVPTVLGDEDKTFTAQWTALTYTVTLWNDGDVSGDKTVDVTYDLMTPNLTELPSKIGYTFGGYCIGLNGEGTKYIDADGKGCHIWNLTSDTTLYAYFYEKDSHHIDYKNIKDANIDENQKIFKESESVMLPTDITTAGYTFLGWYDSSADTANKVTFWAAGAKTSDVVLWAKWTAITYTVSFDANLPDGSQGGGSSAMSAQTFTYDVSNDIPSCSLTAPTGYEFQNWNTKDDGTGISYLGGQNVKNLTDKNETITLYAIWKEKTPHQITYENTKGAVIAANQQNYKESETVTLPTDITAVGYTFIGWYDSSADTAIQVTGWAAGERIGDVTVWAMWNAITYGVEFNNNNGSGSMTPQTFTYDVSYDIPLCSFTAPTGYEFQNWNTKNDGSGTSYSDGQTIKNLTNKNETITLYAIWKEKASHQITYENTKGVTDIEPTTFKESETVTLPTSITAVGYTFLGWYDSSADTASQVTGWNAGERTSNVTLWAKWIQSTLYVTAKTILDGETDTGDGTEENPFASISNAIAKINGYASTTIDYTIVISGEFIGYFGLGVRWDQDSDDGNGIYREWVTDPLVAKSLTLTGKTGSSDDVLKFDSEEGLGYDVLEIQTSVPVTITKLKITGGQTGICVNSDYADLTLGEGCLVTDNGNSSGVCVSAGKLTLNGGSITNNCCEYGGGVSVSGGEFVMLSGTIGGTEEEDANTADYRGAGVYVTGGTFTMKGGTICGNKSSSSASGAGVYVGYDDENGTVGTFVMEGGTISGNEADSAGGGVFVDGSSSELTEKVTFTMKGGTISGNKESSTDSSWGACGGGGVSLYGEHAQFIMEDGTISKNEAACYGGGVSVVGSATFTMSGGTIGGTSAEDGNKVTLSSYSTYGGGVYVGSEAIFTLETGTISYNSTSSTSDTNGGGAVCAFNGTFIMKGGTLTNNTSCGSGGAVYIGKRGTFDMTGGRLIANSAENNGNAVFQCYENGGAGTVKMGADALVVSNNDMYITDVIIITESLTGENPVATITSDEYAPERTILALADGANTTLAAECTKFAVTPQNETENWYINGSGILSKQ